MKHPLQKTRQIKACVPGAFLPKAQFDKYYLHLGRNFFPYTSKVDYLVEAWITERVQLATVLIALAQLDEADERQSKIEDFKTKLLKECSYHLGQYANVKLARGDNSLISLIGEIDRTPTGGYNPFTYRQVNGQAFLSQVRISDSTSYNSPMFASGYNSYKEIGVLLQMKQSNYLVVNQLETLFSLERVMRYDQIIGTRGLSSLLKLDGKDALECVEREIQSRTFE